MLVFEFVRVTEQMSKWGEKKIRIIGEGDLYKIDSATWLDRIVV